MSFSSQDKSLLKKEVFKYVIPSILSMWVFTIYTMVDGMFVAKGVGPTALAGVNIAMPFINMNFGLSLLLGIGSSTIAAIYMGQGKSDIASKVFTQNAVLTFIVSLVTTALALIFTEPFSYILGADETTLPMVMTYLRIIALFNFCFMVGYYLEVLIKTDGHPHKSILGVLGGAIANIVLDYFFVIVFQWGVAGAAWATGFSQLLTLSIFLHHFIFKSTHFKFVKFKINMHQILRTIKIGVAESINEFSLGIITMMFNRQLIEVSGVDGVAIYTVIAYTSNLVTMTIVGINQGILPRISFYFGKLELYKCRFILRLGLIIAFGASLLSWAFCTFYPHPLIAAFFDPVHDFDLFNHAVHAIGLYSFAFLFMGINIVISGFFTSMESPKQALVITLSRGLVTTAISLFTLSYFWGETGVWISICVSEVLTLCLSLILFFARKDQLFNVEHFHQPRH